MKRILLSIFALLLLLSSNILHAQYTQGDIDAARSNLLALSGGDVFQQRIDTILGDISPEKKTTFLEQLPKVQKQYKSKAIITVKDKYIIAIIDYILIELWVQDGGQVISSDTTVSITPTPEIFNENTCDDFNSIMQFRNGKSNDGNIIPNTCDTSIPDGVYSKYYKTGGARFEIPVRNGRYDGTAKWYYEDGALQAKGTYDYGKVIGEYTFYDVLGTLNQKNIYSQDGSVEVIMYFSNGNILSRSEIKNGLQYGVFETFYTNGAKRHISTAYGDTIVGDLKNWYKNGELQTHITETEILIDLESLKLQYGDRVVLSYFIYDNETQELLLGNYGSYEEETVSQDPIYKELIGKEGSQRVEFEASAESIYSEVVEGHPWFGKTLKFDIYIFGIQR